MGTSFSRLCLILLAIGALALAGCGSDGDAGMAGPAGPPGPAGEAAEAPSEAEIEAIVEAVVAEQPEPEIDTTALDDAIAALAATVDDLVTGQADLETKTADPATPLEILGGTKSAMSVNDRNALADKIIGQLNATYDHDGDKAEVNLPEIPPGAASVADPDGDDDVIVDMTTRNIMHARGAGIISGDGTSQDAGFLKHSFTGGPMVDLTSPEDINTLSVKNILVFNEVDLKSFSFRETDKRRVQTGVVGEVIATASPTGVALPALDPTAAPTRRVTTLGKDGSVSVVDTNTITGKISTSQLVTFAGDDRIYESSTATGATGDTRAMITRANGNTITYTNTATTGVDYSSAAAVATILPATSLAQAKMRYKDAEPPTYTVAQHEAKGYGAWLADSFFMAYVINTEDDLILNDPDSSAMKIAWGNRAHDSGPHTNLSGITEGAMWKGLMVGHDMDADAATGGSMVKGNASLTARIIEGSLTSTWDDGKDRVMDVSLDNIIAADGTRVERVADGIHWTDLTLTQSWVDVDPVQERRAVSFSKGKEITGVFYDSGNEIVGEFNKNKILGVFGAREYDMPAMDDMMADN